MKVLLTGANGQLGRELTRQLSQKGVAYVGCDLPEVDITDFEALRGFVSEVCPDVVINCAAMTNVDGCETAREAAFAANATGPKNLALLSSELDYTLVHVSTDYVFDGKGIVGADGVRPYVESDPIDPKTVYGESKAVGEEAVQTLAKKYFIVRTAWLYGDGHNFVKTMLRLSKTHPRITVVNDQIGSPTSTVDLARAILTLLETDAYGLYHGTCEGFCSWYDFTKEIFRLKGIDTEVAPVTSEEYGSKTPRPKYSVLENAGLKALGRNVFRPWQDAIAAYLDDLGEE